MRPKISPTSPAAKPDPIQQVWQQPSIQQPQHLPWGRLWLMMFVVSAVLSATILVLLGMYQRVAPQAAIFRWIPFIQTTTTVVQPSPERDVIIPPAAVNNLSGTAYRITADLGTDGVYSLDATVGLAWPLSSDWLVSLTAAAPAGAPGLVSLPVIGAAQLVTTTLTDPATPFVFYKTANLTAQPITFSSTAIQPGQRIWIITAQAVIPRQILGQTSPRWISSDRLETSWLLDSPVNAPVGSLVVDNNGHVEGVLGSDNHVWPISAINAVVKTIIQRGVIERPSLGIRTIWPASPAATNQPVVPGFLVGAANGDPAVIPKSPADRANLQAGDLLIAIDDQPLTGSIFDVLQADQPGQTINVTYRRLTKEKTVPIKLTTLQP